MRTVTAKADSTGAFRATSGGYGFRLVAALPPQGSPEFLVTNRPGRLPVIVRLDGQGEPLFTFGEARFFGERFKFIEVTGCEDGDCYILETFEHPRELVQPLARPARQGFRLAAAAAVSTSAPSLSTDGYPLRPGQKRITTYFGGTLSVATLWVRQLDGTWFDTQDTADPSSGPRYDTREVAVPGDRFAWRAASANMTQTIEVESEVG